MKRIKLTNSNKVALIDDSDFELVSQYNWHLHSCGTNSYARTFSNGKKPLMHRLILGLGPNDKRQTDHINNNGLNNRQSNLRICTQQQNCFNRRKVKGYYFYRDKWLASIRFNDKFIYLGIFKTEQKAKQARRKAEIKYFGEFAHGYTV